MSLQNTLFTWCDGLINNGTDVLNSKIRDIGESLSEGMSCDNWDEAINSNDLYLQIVNAKDVADTIDAACIFQDLIIDSKKSSFIDIPIRDREKLPAQRLINRKFDDGSLPKRGFVYVAYREKPREIRYVGKAMSPNRMNLALHGNLVGAIHESTKVSFIYPCKSTPTNINDLEGSILKMVIHYDGKPKYNKRIESVTGHENGSDRLERLSVSLSKLLGNLNPYNS
jgi:hypothetical protein